MKFGTDIDAPPPLGTGGVNRTEVFMLKHMMWMCVVAA